MKVLYEETLNENKDIVANVKSPLKNKPQSRGKL